VSSSSVHYLELRGAQHAFDVFTSVRTRRVVRAVERFLGVQWRAHLRALPGRRVDPTSTPGPSADEGSIAGIDDTGTSAADSTATA
jgi:hypothetical protein